MITLDDVIKAEREKLNDLPRTMEELRKIEIKPVVKKDFAITMVSTGQIPPGLAKKPAGMPPGQYKKLLEDWGTASMDFSQQAYEQYLDPEAVVESIQYSSNFDLPNEIQTKQAEYNRNAALTAKGYHPAKVAHPMFTHFINKDLK